MSKAENMKLWNSVAETNPKDTKKVSLGRTFTAIDPYSQVRRATEEFGAASRTWGWEVRQVVPLEDSKEIGVLVRLYTGGDFFVEQFGQSGLYIDRDCKKKDGDCLKKATTDGLTKCLSYLGFNADVFTGKFDDNKYVAEMNQKFDKISPEPINQEKVDNAVIFFKKQIDMDAIDETHGSIKCHFKTLSNDEKMAVADQLTDKAPDSNKMYKSLLKDHLGFKPTPEGRERS